MSSSTLGKQRRSRYQPSILAFIIPSLLCAAFYGHYNRGISSKSAVIKGSDIHEAEITDLSDAYANASQLVIRDDFSCTKDKECKTKAWSADTVWKPENVLIVSSCGGFFGGKKGICGFGRLDLCIIQ